METRLAELSEEACKDRKLRKEAEASAQTYKEQYESRETEIGDLQMDLERVRTTIKKKSDDLVVHVKEKEQEVYDKEFQMCNMEVGTVAPSSTMGGCMCGCDVCVVCLCGCAHTL